MSGLLRAAIPALPQKRDPPGKKYGEHSGQGGGKGNARRPG